MRLICQICDLDPVYSELDGVYRVYTLALEGPIGHTYLTHESHTLLCCSANLYLSRQP